MKRTDSLQPATLDECNLVLAQFPDLTAPGIDSYYAAQHERTNARRARVSGGEWRPFAAPTPSPLKPDPHDKELLR